MREFPVIESMTTIRLNNLIVRVWRDEIEVKDLYENHDLIHGNPYLTSVIAEFNEGADRQLSPGRVARGIAMAARVSAVEVKDHAGNGIVIYTQWP